MTFLLAETSIQVVLGMFFLFFSNANFQFNTRELTFKSYTSAEALSTIKQIELIDKYEFARAILNKNSKTFVVHVSAIGALEPTIYPF